MLKFGKKKGDKAAEAGEGETPPVAEGEDAGGEGAPAKKKLPLLFIIIPAAVLVLGGGGGAAFFLMKPKPAEAEAAGDAHGAPAKGGHDKKADKKARAVGMVRRPAVMPTRPWVRSPRGRTALPSSRCLTWW